MSQTNTPGRDPRKFVGSMFDLGYGAADEALTRDEVRGQLKDAGVDPDAAWARASKILAAARGRLRLEDARAARSAASDTERAVVCGDTRESLLAQIREMFAAAGTNTSAMYANRWTEGSVEDLAALRDQLKRTIEREARRRDGKR